MNLTHPQIQAAIDTAFASTPVPPVRVYVVNIGDNCTLQTDVYSGLKGSGFQIVATIDRGYDKLQIVRQHGPETWREKPFVPVSYSKLTIIKELDKLEKLSTFITYLELDSHKPLKWQWDAASCIMSSDDTFMEIAPLLQKMFGLTNAQFVAFLKRCETV